MLLRAFRPALQPPVACPSGKGGAVGAAGPSPRRPAGARFVTAASHRAAHPATPPSHASVADAAAGTAWAAVGGTPLVGEHVRAVPTTGLGAVPPPAPGARVFLVCVDPSSAHPLRGVQWLTAKTFARAGDTAHLVAVLPIDKAGEASVPSIRLDFSAPEDTLWKAGEASRSLLQDGCELLRRAGVYGVAHVLAERTTESVAAAVCASAEKVGADAVVVSSSGKGWLQSALQGGSLTRQVLAEAAVPVLVVPPPSRMPDVV